MSEWRPIETAPRDGSVFIVWTPSCSRVPNPHIDMCEWDDELGDFIKHGCGLDYVTHWRPMLDPPRE